MKSECTFTRGVSYALYISLLVSKLFCTKGGQFRDEGDGRGWGGGCHFRAQKSQIAFDMDLPAWRDVSGMKYNYLCIYDLYSPVHNVLDVRISFESFLGPVKWRRADR